MRGVSLWFFLTAILCVTLGMMWGIEMAASGDHTLFPAHAHLNLVGWVTMALFGLYYHAVPESGAKTLAKVHYITATVGLVIMIPGIVLALQEKGDIVAAVGSVLTFASMLIFGFTVYRDRKS